MKQSHEDAQATLTDRLGNATQHYQRYMMYEEEYNAKVKVFHEAYSNALADPIKFQTWPIDALSYQNDIDTAMDRWMSLGFKFEIEQAITTLKTQGDGLFIKSPSANNNTPTTGE